MSPVKTEFSHEQAAEVVGPSRKHTSMVIMTTEARIEEELDLTKPRTRTQSSHAYEPISIQPLDDQLGESGVKIANGSPQ